MISGCSWSSSLLQFRPFDILVSWNYVLSLRIMQCFSVSFAKASVFSVPPKIHEIDFKRTKSSLSSFSREISWELEIELPLFLYVLPPFQIVGCFDKSKYIIFTMYIDKHYIMAKIIYLDFSRRSTIWNGGRSCTSFLSACWTAVGRMAWFQINILDLTSRTPAAAAGAGCVALHPELQ